MKKIDLTVIRETLYSSPIIALLVTGCFIILSILNLLSSSQLIFNPTMITTTPYRAPSTVDLKQIAKLHLMGADESGNLPLASLGVNLVGIFLDNSGQSSALIAMASGDTQTYHTGDVLAPNVSIEKILSDQVIVRHNGRLEKLTLPIQPIDFNNNLPDSGLWH